MAQRDVVVVGASAGGVEAITRLLSPLPADLPACVLVVLHTPATGVNALATILSRVTALKVVAAEGETPFERGSVIVARPDHHLLVVDDRVILTRGPRENGHRPAVDVLFRSAARVLGPRVVGVVLSGALDDGSAGLVSVRARGGVAIVQDPLDAAQPGMPANAIAAADPEHVLPLDAIPATLTGLVGAEVGEVPTPAPGDPLGEEVEIARHGSSRAAGRQHYQSNPAGLTCPDCHGPLFAIDEAGYVRYRCLTGHAWSAESLLAETDAALEGALWMGLRSLEEKASLADNMSTRARTHDQPLVARRFAEQAAEAREAAALIRRTLLANPGAGRAGDHAEQSESTESA
ncbi:chemotaxis protein CheB [Kineosporia sp. J2-2]|uniref:protein-glutamate methylesterase n=1 Tax=Kineosporia corallincola TaxID=2835133 RepID=A0ABS5TGV2_9ACTN|nr:chemotaxis protein CheB [Kineosporia corallincola]MBT0769619.1 chemotaxis protein CheB [Kineosporia corallincola]